jgi:hypothetical protein
MRTISAKHLRHLRKAFAGPPTERAGPIKLGSLFSEIVEWEIAGDTG